MADSTKKWTQYLEEEDLAFLKRFLLASGSLKEVAKIYGIIYPTVRLRLDRLIAKVRVIESDQVMGDFERRLRSLFAEGKLDAATLKTLLSAYQEEKE